MRAIVASALLLLCHALLAPSAASAQPRFETPDLDGYVVAHEAESRAGSIREEIPAGEDVDNWTSMVTTQRFGGPLEPAAHPMVFAENLRRAVEASCPDAPMSNPSEVEHQGFEGATFSATCLRTPPHGGPETFFHHGASCR